MAPAKDVRSSIFKRYRISMRLRVLIAYVLGPLLLWSPTRIRRELEQRGNVYLPSIPAICLFCKKFRATGKIGDKPRPGRRSRWKGYMSDAVDAWIDAKRDITAAEIRIKLETSFKARFSMSQIRHRVYKLGWRKTKTRYCQMVRDANKPKRLVHALNCLVNNDHFRDVLFTDEASIEVGGCGKMTFRRNNERSVFGKVPKPKHPFKVHVWAGISYRGATSIAVFTGLLNSDSYIRILTDHLLPFGPRAYPEGYRFMQDNDPKHTSKKTQEFLKDNGIRYWPTPPESPDMNPIEMVWAQLKWHLGKMKPRNKEELTNGIRDFWCTLTPEKCQPYIDHLKKVIPHVILRKGAASGY